MSNGVPICLAGMEYWTADGFPADIDIPTYSGLDYWQDSGPFPGVGTFLGAITATGAITLGALTALGYGTVIIPKRVFPVPPPQRQLQSQPGKRKFPIVT